MDFISQRSFSSPLQPESKTLSLLLYNMQGIRHSYSKIRAFLGDVRPNLH